jgi:hypothetical protein
MSRKGGHLKQTYVNLLLDAKENIASPTFALHTLTVIKAK